MRSEAAIKVRLKELNEHHSPMLRNKAETAKQFNSLELLNAITQDIGEIEAQIEILEWVLEEEPKSGES